MRIGDYIVHVVDDDESMRKSLAFLLATAGFAVRVHHSATAFLAVVNAAGTELGRGCLVTDLKMPDMNGIDLLHGLRDADAMMPAVVITGHGDVPMAVAAMKAGAVDFIEKPFQDEILIAAIEQAVERHSAAPLGYADTDTIRSRLEVLTERERQVLFAVVAGRPNKTIAHDLDISPRTVEVHRANVMTKMQAKSLPELVRMVLTIEPD